MEAEKNLPQDSKLAEFLSRIGVNISIKTEPPGANIYLKAYTAPEGEWTYLGISPIDKIRLPIGLIRWKMEKERYETVFAVAPTFGGLLEAKWFPYDIVRTLDKKGSIPIGKVRAKGEKELGDFFLDQSAPLSRTLLESKDRHNRRTLESTGVHAMLYSAGFNVSACKGAW